MSNFDAFHYTISLNISLLFLKSSLILVKRRRMAAGQKISTHKNSALAFKSGENGVNFQLVSVHLLYLYLGLTSFCWVSDVVQLRTDKKVSYLVLYLSTESPKSNCCF